MRSIAHQWSTLAVAATLLGACGGSGSDPEPENAVDEPDASPPTANTGRDLEAAPRWRVDGRFDYTSDPANARSTTDANGTDANFGATVISTSGFGDGHGAWSGSGVGVTYSLDGSGTYALVAQDEFARSLQQSPGTAVAYFYIQAGLNAVGDGGLPNSTRWRSTGGTVDVVVDDEGLYHFFADEPVPLVVDIELGSGIPDRPNDTTVTFSNVWGVATNGTASLEPDE